MKKNIFKCSLLLSALALSIGANAQSGKNYKYTFKSACNCIISKNNPAGIEKITVGLYTSDPTVHQLIGYYNKTAKTKVDTFSLSNFSPKDFQCYPCVTLAPNTKYVFYFPGKDDMDEVMMLISTDDKSVPKEVK